LRFIVLKQYRATAERENGQPSQNEPSKSWEETHADHLLLSYPTGGDTGPHRPARKLLL